MNTRLSKSTGFLLLIGLLLLAVMPLAAQEEVYFPTTEWRTSTPEEQGMDSAELADFFQTYSQPEFNLDSLMVIRNGHIVAEAYAPPFRPEMKHHLYSASKSVTGALIGILLQDGTLKSLDTPVLDLFPDRKVQHLDANKKAMTVRHLLTMSAGWDCDYHAPGGDLQDIAMMTSEDWLQFALDMPMGSKPGTEFHYCNPVSYVLSAIVTELTGKSALDFAAERLFAPLGITDYAWSSSPQGISYGFSDLQLTTRDMAKFGYLYLNGGRWDRMQVVPSDFVAEATSAVIPTPWPSTSYGYQWWTNDDLSTAIAVGWGGQYIQINPAQNSVAVLTGGYTDNIRIATHVFPFMYMLGGLTVSEDALPDNPDALRRLEDVITAIERPEAVTVKPVPEVGLQVNNQGYALLKPFMLRAFGSAEIVEAINVTGVRFDFSNADQAALTFTLEDGQAWAAPIGMNGVYQVTDGPYGPLGIRGEWLNDDTFCLLVKLVGDAPVMRLEAMFLPGAVNIVGSEYVSGAAFTAQGVAMPE